MVRLLYMGLIAIGWFWPAIVSSHSIFHLTLDGTPATTHVNRALQAEETEYRQFQFVRIYMAMPVRITVCCENRQLAESACKEAFTLVGKLEKIFSNYDPNSESIRLAATAKNTKVKVSPHLMQVLEFSAELARKSNGAFDPSVGTLSEIWRRARRTKRLPDTIDIHRARQATGFAKIVIDRNDQTVELLTSRMQLDFGGVAKGYIGDRVIEFLRTRGIEAACYEAGGDIVVGSAPPGESGWKIDVARDKPEYFSNCAISISGDTVQFLEVNGKRYSHVIDPRTGIGVTTSKMAVAIASCGMYSDALATCGTILSDREYQSLLESFQARGWSKLAKKATIPDDSHR